jgi:hypothetical protein
LLQPERKDELAAGGKLDAAKRSEIAQSVITGRKTGEMARFYGVSQPTVSRTVAQHRRTDAWLSSAPGRPARTTQP